MSRDPEVDRAIWGRLDEAPMLPDLRRLEIIIWARDASQVTPPLELFQMKIVNGLDVIQGGADNAGRLPLVGDWGRTGNGESSGCRCLSQEDM